MRVNFFKSTYLILNSALQLHLLRFSIQASAQTACTPLMQSLVQQAELSADYGSWDACCARTGVDCSITRQPAPPGFEPCDVAHSARASCNKVPQGTICMIGHDGLIDGSPCGQSQIRSCGNILTLNGTSGTLNSDALPVGVNPSSILARGVLGTQLCCSASSCQLSSTPCTSADLMACVSDGTNIICVPFDAGGYLTYLAAIPQDDRFCAVTTTFVSTVLNSASFTITNNPSSPGNSAAVPTRILSRKHNKDRAIVGGVVAGVILAICIAGATAFICLRRRQRRQRMVITTARVSQGTPATHLAPPSFYPSMAQNTAHPVVHAPVGHGPLVPYPIAPLPLHSTVEYAHHRRNPPEVTMIDLDRNQDAFFASTQPASSTFTHAQTVRATGSVSRDTNYQSAPPSEATVIGQGSLPRRDAAFSPPPPYDSKS